MMNSWRTSLMGFLTAIGGIIVNLMALLDDDPTTAFSIEGFIAILAGLGLLAARDERK